MSNSNPNTNRLLWIVGICTSLFFGYLAFRKFEWRQLLEMFREIDPVFLVTAGLLMVLSFSLRAYRWQYFLPENRKFTFGSRLSGIAFGYFFSNILPGRLGDVLRPAYLSRANDQKFQVCLYSIVLERVWELVLFLVLAAIIFKHSGIRLPASLSINYYLLAGLVAIGVCFLVFARQVLTVVARIGNNLNLRFIHKHAREVLDAFDSGIHPRKTFLIITLSVLVFFIEGCFFVCLIRAAGIPISIPNGIMVMIISALSIMLPSAPSAVGIFHFFCQASLMLFGVEKNLALSAAILIHAYMFIFDLFFAAACFAASPLRKTFFKNGNGLARFRETEPDHPKGMSC